MDTSEDQNFDTREGVMNDEGTPDFSGVDRSDDRFGDCGVEVPARPYVKGTPVQIQMI